MATYKLIQDIEADDHILGPLSLRQFIFGLIAAFLGYLCFIAVVKHLILLLLFFLPPALFCGFFAFPWGRDQPTETWALAKLRFWFKPRRRVWNQSGLKELVTITVPKKIEHVYSDGLSQTEVKSRLQALANTIDSRGWAIKHINAIGFVPQQNSSDRLIDIPIVPGETTSETAADDIMDADHNPIAQQFESMINKSSQDRRQRLMEELQKPVPAAPVAPVSDPAPQWFMNHNPVPAPATPTPAYPAMQTPASESSVSGALPTAPVPPAAPPVISVQSVASAPDDAMLSSQLRSHARPSEAYGNLRTLQPLGTKTAASTADPASPVPADPYGASDNTSSPMTASSDPAILSLSKNNDLNVATIAREAQRAKKGGAQDEVVISLH